MKVIAIGDLHLKMVPGVSKRWQIERYKQFINDIILECEEKRAILAIAGDTFDSIDPKKEEIQLFMYLMHELAKREITTLLVSGNHETIKKGESILDFMEVSQFPNVSYRTSLTVDDVTFHLCNHDSISDYRPKLKKGRNILISHFRCTYNKFVTEEIDVAALVEPFDLCIAGDIHDAFAVDKVMYTNNPINKEFDANPDCGYVEVTFDKDYQNIYRVSTKYPSLVGKKVKASEWEGLKFNKQHYYRVEVEGSAAELKALPKPPDNVILIKVPIVDSVFIDAPLADQLKVDGWCVGDDDLIGYMKLLNCSDTMISEMMLELRRPCENTVH